MSPKFEKLDKNLTLYMMVSYHRQPMFLLQVEKYLTSVNLWAPSDFEFNYLTEGERWGKVKKPDTRKSKSQALFLG
jgi:hypothetical protein